MNSRSSIAQDLDQPPRLLVLIAVEEEFDWTREFDRNATSVTHMSDLQRALPIFEDAGIVPVGVVTHPVADQAAAPLREMAASGRLIVGAHLHPWVNPPHEEVVNRHNSYPGNLAEQLEEAKLKELCSSIEEKIGVEPRIYQAGRYGLGPNSYSILKRLGIEVSMSVNPPFDYRAEGGPDYSVESNDPFWCGGESPLLEIPVTGAFIGSAGRRAPGLYRLARTKTLGWSRLPAVLARLGIVERIRLSPEGHSLQDLVRLTRSLLSRGVRVFTLSFHSPTLKPGCTSYVQSGADLERFLDHCRAYFDFFLGELGGQASTPLALREELLAKSPPGQALQETPVTR